MSPGEALAVHGAATAAEHAGEDWISSALRHAREFLALVGETGGRFQATNIRAFAEMMGLPPAPDSRAWGHIMRHLKRDGLIVAAGVGRSHDPRQHNGFTTEWVAK